MSLVTYCLRGRRDRNLHPAEEFLEEQPCTSRMVFVFLFLNYSRAGSLQLCYRLPLCARLQKLKTKEIFCSLPQPLGESHQKANEAELVTQKLSTLVWRAREAWPGVKLGGEGVWFLS